MLNRFNANSDCHFRNAFAVFLILFFFFSPFFSLFHFFFSLPSRGLSVDLGRQGECNNWSPFHSHHGESCHLLFAKALPSNMFLTLAQRQREEH